ncbi:BRCA1-associated ATM activator 1-like [Ptychodera flava]|uniref:BRCA1-associated ATM activator 1-like n=1 Tax=Ptychodera flava TaxID=63121 RepID=UPI003969FAB7
MDECFKRLPEVFDVLLDPSKSVVDDTCIEKFLSWLKELISVSDTRTRLLQKSAGVSTFLQKIASTNCEAETLAFGLRLTGVLCQHSDALDDLGNGADQTGDALPQTAFQKAKEGEYWEDAAVRCAWFQGVNAMVTNTGTLGILTKIGAVDSAFLCLDDKSMFVTSAAQDFLVAFILMSHKSDSKAGNTEDCSMTREQRVGSVKDLKSDFDTKVWEDDCEGRKVVKNDLVSSEENKSVTNKTTSDMKTYSSFMKRLKETLVQNDAHAEEQNTLSLIVSILQLIRKLFEADYSIACAIAKETDLVSCCQGLIGREDGAAMDDHVVELFAFWMHRKERSTDTCTWLKTDILNQMVSAFVMSGRFRSALKLAECLYCHHPSNQLLDVIVLPFIAIWGDEASSNTVVVPEALKQQLSSKSPCVNLLCQSVHAIREVLSQDVSFEDSSMIQTIEYISHLLSLCSTDNPSRVPTTLARNAIGSSRLTRAILDLTLVLSMKPCLLGAAMTGISEILVKIVDNPQSECVVVSKALDVIVSHLHEYMKSQQDDNYDVTAPSVKRPRLTTSEVPQSVNQFLSGKFASVLHKRSYDSRWEVRDSVVAFFDKVLAKQMGDRLLTDWMIENQLYKLAWEKLTDAESYVRATAVQTLCQISTCDVLWNEFLSNSQLSQEKVVAEIIGVLLHDEEAFPRRAAAKAILSWFTGHSEIRMYVLKQHSCKRHHQKETCSERNDIPSDEAILDEANETAEKTVYEAMVHASKDWDFEVKLLTLGFWKSVVDHFLPDNRINEVNTSDKKLTAAELPSCDQIWHGLLEMWSTGGLTCLKEAMDDCDRLVAEKACRIVLNLKDRLQADDNFNTDPETKNKNFKELAAFVSHVLTSDLTSILAEKTKSIDVYEENPLSLLEDILSCEATNAENILDCY